VFHAANTRIFFQLSNKKAHTGRDFAGFILYGQSSRYFLIFGRGLHRLGASRRFLFLSAEGFAGCPAHHHATPSGNTLLSAALNRHQACDNAQLKFVHA